MRYVMKQKLLSWGDDYVIRNEDGADVFLVDGKAFSLGSKLSLQDMQGNQLAYIKQKLLALGPSYEIYRRDEIYRDELCATIKKELFTFFKCSFVVHLEGAGDLEAVGDLSDHEYTITRTGQPIAQISKQWFTWADTYGVNVAEGEDPVLILASTVVIDQACHGDRD